MPRTRTQQMFSQADAYELFMGRWSALLGRALIDFCEIRDGDAILDVGCGSEATGQTTPLPA